MWFIFNLRRRKLYSIIQDTLIVFTCERKFLTKGNGYQCMMQTSLHSGPMLKINRPISHQLLAPTCSLFSPRCTQHLFITISTKEGHISMLESPLCLALFRFSPILRELSSLAATHEPLCSFGLVGRNISTE
jgi:hypothetical protein